VGSVVSVKDEPRVSRRQLDDEFMWEREFWANEIERYDREEMAEFHRIERTAVRIEIWAYRIAAVLLIAALVWTAFNSDRRSTPPPSHPVITLSDR
jgi:hypothetical protein